MQVLGGRASLAFGAEPDIKEWSDSLALNPARVPPGQAVDDDLATAAERFRTADRAQGSRQWPRSRTFGFRGSAIIVQGRMADTDPACQPGRGS